MSNDASNRQRIKEILVEALKLEMAPGDIGDDTTLWGEGGLGLDSVDALELMVDLEKEYGISIDEEDVDQEALASVANLEKLVERLRASAAAGEGGR